MYFHRFIEPYGPEIDFTTLSYQVFITEKNLLE